MDVVNFAHPITGEQIAEIEQITGEKVERVINVNSQIDFEKPLRQQIYDMLGSANVDWKNGDVVVNAPSLAISAALVVAAIHEIRGVFPRILQLKREDGVFPKWHVVDVIFPG